MKKAILTLSIVVSLAASAQTKFENDTLYFDSGFKITKGQELKFGTGTMDNGNFKFIRVNSTGFAAIMTATDNQAYNNSQNSLNRSMAGHKGTVVKIVQRGTKKTGYIFQPLVSIGSGVRYEIDVENAIASGELAVPDEFKPKTKESKSTLSAADELAKFKKLYDDGVITKEEFDAAKAKILARQ